MNFINARPVLVDCEKPIEIGSLFEYVKKKPMHDNDLDGKIGSLIKNKNSYLRPSSHYKHKELVLIDLDNKNISSGDKVIINGESKIFTIKQIIDERVFLFEYPHLTISLDIINKIITTQEQLSPEYIDMFVDEYNSAAVRDIKINPIIQSTTGYITIINSDVATIQGVINKYTKKLNTLRDNRVKLEEELKHSNDMIKLLESILIDLNKVLN